MKRVNFHARNYTECHFAFDAAAAHISREQARKVRVGRDVRTDAARQTPLSSRAVRVYLLRGVFFLAPSRHMPNTHRGSTLCFYTASVERGEREKKRNAAAQERDFPKRTHTLLLSILADALDVRA